MAFHCRCLALVTQISGDSCGEKETPEKRLYLAFWWYLVVSGTPTEPTRAEREEKSECSIRRIFFRATALLSVVMVGQLFFLFRSIGIRSRSRQREHGVVYGLYFFCFDAVSLAGSISGGSIELATNVRTIIMNTVRGTTSHSWHEWGEICVVVDAEDA